MASRLPTNKAAGAASSGSTSGNPGLPELAPSAFSSIHDDDADSLVGQIVGERYRIEERLGVGGMGAVYRATHIHMRKTMALKVLHQEMSWKPEAVARFEREAVAAGRIEHPNVAAAKDFGRLDERSFYMALEFVEGRSLRYTLHEERTLDAARVVNIARQVGEALRAAHEQGIVHRDLKPENIMLQNEGTESEFVKVLDFGLAKISLEDDEPESSVDAPTELTKMGTVFGTPSYMSPEQAAGKPADHRCDLYSLGIVLYEMLSGGVPFRGDAIVVVLTKHIHEPPPALPDSVDPGLANLIRHLLAKDPAQRPATAQAFLDELSRLQIAKPTSALTPASASLQSFTQSTKLLSQRVAQWCQLTLVPTATRLWQTACERVPALRQLERPVALGPLRAPIGVLGVAAAAMFALVMLIALWPETSEDVAASDGDTVDDVVLTEEAELDVEIADVQLTKEEQDQLADIAALPVYKRKLNDWLTLGALHAKAGRWAKSTAAYRNATQLDKSARSDPQVLQAIRTAAEQRDSYEAAISLASTKLGEEGVDLLYDLWMNTKSDKKQRLINDLAYKKLQILHLSKASKALRVRLELEFADPNECEPLKKTVERAMRYADHRSIDALSALKKTDGCGASKTRDCYACLRGTTDLDAAIETARELEPPRFDGKRYIPAP